MTRFHIRGHLAGDYDSETLRQLMHERRIDGTTPVALHADGEFMPLRDHPQAIAALGWESGALKVRRAAGTAIPAPLTEHDRAITGTLDNTAQAMLRANNAYERSLRPEQPPIPFLKTSAGRHVLRWLKINGSVSIAAALLHLLLGVEGVAWGLVQIAVIITAGLTMRRNPHELAE